ncbi:E3 ubiquitin-protein ligase nedd4, partial [Rhizoclosmatium hyalinum]
TLSPHVFRLLVEDTIRLEWSDFETLDQELWKSWDWVMKAGKSELKAAELTFSYESHNRKGQVLTKAFSGYEGTEVVDVKNREEFVKLAAKNHVRRVRFKIVAFREGFCSVIPRKILRILQPTDFELILCGMPTINAQEWRSATKYNSYSLDIDVTTTKHSLLIDWNVADTCGWVLEWDMGVYDWIHGCFEYQFAHFQYVF